MTETRTATYALAQSDTPVKAASSLKTKSESQKVAGANPNRVALVVCNPGAVDVYLGLGGAAVVGEGIYLKKESGVHVIDYFLGEVTAISKESEPTITFSEV